MAEVLLELLACSVECEVGQRADTIDVDAQLGTIHRDALVDCEFGTGEWPTLFIYEEMGLHHHLRLTIW
jgi:hypothetical protein